MSSTISDNCWYILVKGGTFVMGETKVEATVPDLYFAQYPVTNRLYRDFLNATGHREPKYWDDKRFKGDDQPVVGVDWNDATAYCQWLSKDSVTYRLPTEEEWEWAAGRGKRTYPWGDEEPDDQRANWNNNVGQTTSVGNYPAGATPEGLMDMAGNVWEWTDTLHSWYGHLIESDRIVRGGSWFISYPEGMSCACRYLRFPDGGINDLGFRVVRAIK